MKVSKAFRLVTAMRMQWPTNTSFIIFYMPELFVFAASDIEIEHSFIGGGSSTQSDFKLLKPYIISTNILVQNPKEFNYVYDGHGSFNNIVQNFQACRENYIKYSSWFYCQYFNNDSGK